MVDEACHVAAQGTINCVLRTVEVLQIQQVVLSMILIGRFTSCCLFVGQYIPDVLTHELPRWDARLW